MCFIKSEVIVQSNAAKTHFFQLDLGLGLLGLGTLQLFLGLVPLNQIFLKNTIFTILNSKLIRIVPIKLRQQNVNIVFQIPNPNDDCLLNDTKLISANPPTKKGFL